MTGKERMMCFLNGGRPDTIPVCPMFDRDYMIKAAGLGNRNWDEMANPERLAVIEGCYERHRNVDFIFCPTGRGSLPRIEPPSIESKITPQMLKELWQEPLSSQQILDSKIYEYMPQLLKNYGNDVLLAFTINVPLAYAMNIFGGYENGLVAMAQRTEEFKLVYMELCRRTASFLKTGSLLGMQCVWITQYYAGADTISPGMYREVVLPGEKFLFQEARNLNLKTMYWFLGDLMPILKDLLEVRPDALVLEPGRKGYVIDVGVIRKTAGNDVGLCGFPDEQHMVDGNRKGISDAVQQQIRTAGSGPLAMTTPILKADVDESTVDFFIDEVHKYKIS